MKVRKYLISSFPQPRKPLFPDLDRPAAQALGLVQVLEPSLRPRNRIVTLFLFFFLATLGVLASLDVR